MAVFLLHAMAARAWLGGRLPPCLALVAAVQYVVHCAPPWLAAWAAYCAPAGGCVKLLSREAGRRAARQPVRSASLASAAQMYRPTSSQGGGKHVSITIELTTHCLVD